MISLVWWVYWEFLEFVFKNIVCLKFKFYKLELFFELRLHHVNYNCTFQSIFSLFHYYKDFFGWEKNAQLRCILENQVNFKTILNPSLHVLRFQASQQLDQFHRNKRTCPFIYKTDWLTVTHEFVIINSEYSIWNSKRKLLHTLCAKSIVQNHKWEQEKEQWWQWSVWLSILKVWKFCF